MELVSVAVEPLSLAVPREIRPEEVDHVVWLIPSVSWVKRGRD